MTNWSVLFCNLPGSPGYRSTKERLLGEYRPKRNSAQRLALLSFVTLESFHGVVSYVNEYGRNIKCSNPTADHSRNRRAKRDSPE